MELLLLTTPISSIHAETNRQFRDDLHNNTVAHPELKDIPNQIDAHKRISLGEAKSILIRAAHREGWACKHKGIYIYENHSGNKILSSVVRCTQVGSEINTEAYVGDILEIFNNMPEYYPYSWSSTNAEIKSHLDGVVASRESSRTIL